MAVSLWCASVAFGQRLRWPLMERSGEWIPFGSKRFVRSLQVYEDLLFEFDFTEVRLAAVAPFGGPLAFVLTSSPMCVSVFTAGSRHLWNSVVPVDAGSIEAVGWSHEETLVVITSKPSCMAWNPLRGAFFPIGLPRSIISGDLLLTLIRPVSAFLARRDGGSIVTISFPERKEPVAVETALPLDQVSCADALAAALCEEDKEIVYVAGMIHSKLRVTHTIVTFTPGDSEVSLSEAVFPAPIQHMVVSPNGTHIAVALGNGFVVTVASDLSAVLKRVDTGLPRSPIALQWCGSSFLHLQYSAAQFSGNSSEEISHISMLLPATGPTTHKDVRKWDLEGSGIVFAATEIDGLRILSERTNYFFEIVPVCLAEIYSRGSKSDVSALCQAALESTQGTIDGIAALRSISAQLTDLYETLDSIIAAAAAEFTEDAQERLLSVVAILTAHGWVKYDSDVFVDVCKRLRFFNNIRNVHNCALPISHAQYLALNGSTELRQLQPREAQVIVDRLVQRGDFGWAANVASFMGMKIEKILTQWSVHQVIHSTTDDQDTHARILGNMRRCPGAGFTEAALEAAALGKQRLAVQLLDSEPRSHAQVLLLLQMGLDEIAMEKAVASHDADLTYLVLLKLRQQMPTPDFFAALNRFEVARMQFLSAAQYSADLSVTSTRYLMDAHFERHVAIQRLDAFFQPVFLTQTAVASSTGDAESPIAVPDDDELRRCIAATDRLSVSAIGEVEQLFAASDATKDEAHLCALHRALLLEQDRIVAETGDTVVMNLSLVETLKYCIKYLMEDRAEELRKKFEVPDKKYWYCKLLALCDAEQWEAVERMGGVGRYKPVKSPIGFLPFVEALYEKKQFEKAAAFVPKLATTVQRVEWFVKLDEFQMAVDDAYGAENADLLRQIRRRAHNPSIIQYIDERLKTMKS